MQKILIYILVFVSISGLLVAGGAGNPFERINKEIDDMKEIIAKTKRNDKSMYMNMLKKLENEKQEILEKEKAPWIKKISQLKSKLENEKKEIAKKQIERSIDACEEELKKLEDMASGKKLVSKKKATKTKPGRTAGKK